MDTMGSDGDIGGRRRWLGARVVARAGKIVRDRRAAAYLRHRPVDAPCRIILGAGYTQYEGWVSTDRSTLDVLREADWERYFRPGEVDAILAEHVWEHLTPADAERGLSYCYRYLKPGGYLRLAVPDGGHPDPDYRRAVEPGGTGPGARDHKILYTQEMLGQLLDRVGFTCRWLEYFDEGGKFHGEQWSPEQGPIDRSLHYDPRNAGGEPRFTSLLVDAFKPL